MKEDSENQRNGEKGEKLRTRGKHTKGKRYENLEI